MPEAVIVSALRTPIGTAMKGTLRDTDAYQLADHVVGSAVADLDGGTIDDILLGEGTSCRDHGRVAVSAGAGAEPALRRRPGRRAERRGEHSRRHGPAGDRGRGQLGVDVSPVQAPGR